MEGAPRNDFPGIFRFSLHLFAFTIVFVELSSVRERFGPISVLVVGDIAIDDEADVMAFSDDTGFEFSFCCIGGVVSVV
jgi:hypothetical protein